VLAACGLAGCATDAAAGNSTPTVTVVQTATTTVAATQTRTATVTKTVERTRTVTAAPVPTAVNAGPMDVTAQYVAWRKRHHAADGDAASQYQDVRQAILDNRRLEVVTRFPPWGAAHWNCEGEPSSLGGQQILQVSILFSDSSSYVTCPPGQ
jgi:hypothetical protein